MTASPRAGFTTPPSTGRLHVPARASQEADELAEESTGAAPSVELKPGDRASHRYFGRGVVLKVEQTRDSTTVEVVFEAKGKKTLDLAFAALQKL